MVPLALVQGGSRTAPTFFPLEARPGRRIHSTGQGRGVHEGVEGRHLSAPLLIGYFSSGGRVVLTQPNVRRTTAAIGRLTTASMISHPNPIHNPAPDIIATLSLF